MHDAKIKSVELNPNPQKNRGLGILERSTVMKKTTYWKDVWRTFVASKGVCSLLPCLWHWDPFGLDWS